MRRGATTSLNQLTNVTAASENLTYNYPTGANNGKVSSMYNAVSGETVTYTYDSLNRLLTANGSGWGDQYGFDAFGNLLSKTVTAGSAPSMSISVNPANNQIQGIGLAYDANGNTETTFNNGSTFNLSYDAENRLNSLSGSLGQVLSYAYDAQNKRIWSWAGATDTSGNAINYAVNFYTPGGQKLGEYQIAPTTHNNSPVLNVTLLSSDQYFGGRRLAVMDQLGSAGNNPFSGGTYYPWGENKGSTNPQDSWSFASYWQDSVSGLDYANNRYYSNAYGRFMTPDPYQGTSGGPGDANNPQSWDRYAYVFGDPVNWIDPYGLDGCPAGTQPGPNGDGCVPISPPTPSPTIPVPAPTSPTPRPPKGPGASTCPLGWSKDRMVIALRPSRRGRIATTECSSSSTRTLRR